MDQHEISSGLLGVIPGLLFIAIVIISLAVAITEWAVRETKKAKNIVDKPKDRDFYLGDD